MTVEEDLYAVLSGVCERAYPDIAPVGTAKPYVTYQQIGGQVIKPLGKVVPDKQNGEYQVNVWADTRKEAKTLILAIEAGLCLASAFIAKPISASRSDYDHDNAVYGSIQDFSIWSER
jgi:hypothetical protein